MARVHRMRIGQLREEWKCAITRSLTDAEAKQVPCSGLPSWARLAVEKRQRSFPLIAQLWGCDRSLSFSEGAVTCPEPFAFNSARLFTPAGGCPLHARAIVMLSFWQNILFCRTNLYLPSARKRNSAIFHSPVCFSSQSGASGRSSPSQALET